MSGINSMYGNSISLMSKSLDYLWTKQSVISDNIANVDTPGYKSKIVTFEDTFRQRLAAAAKSEDNQQIRQTINNSRIQIQETPGESARLDENNVNADTELIEMTRTALQYQYGVQTVNSDITRLRTVIKGQ